MRSKSASLNDYIGEVLGLRLSALLLFLLLLSVGVLAGQAVPGHAKSVAAVKTKSAPRSTASPLLRRLSLHDRIAQMIVVRGYGDWPPDSNAEYRRFSRWILEDRVGGFIVAGRIRNGNVIPAQPFEMAAFINHMQRKARTPLLVASDFERGASMRVAETARFPYLMAFGAAHDLGAIKQLGSATASEARTLGVNWVFAPDADVNNNPDNPIINVRSFGEDPQAVARDVAAFIAGAHSDPSNYVLVAAKHFPGHGDTAEDSHLQLANLNQSKDRIETVELVPFRAAVKAGVDSIMTAHMSVPAFEPKSLPATVSPNILTGLLRNELGFDGLIVTDALEMAGIASLYSQGEAAVRAVEAGADVLLMPSDPEACIRSLMNAVTTGRISTARINASASKIIAAKTRVGLYRNRFVSVDHISNRIEDPKLQDLAEKIAERAITLVRDEQHLFPAPDMNSSCLIVATESQFSQRGEILAADLKRAGPQLKVVVVNSSMSDKLLSATADDTSSCKEIYVATFVTVTAYRGSVALEGGLTSFLNTLVHGTVPVAIISLGNPYLLRYVPEAKTYLATFSTVVSSEAAVAKAILGRIPISGRMPVSIPGLVKAGDGMDVPALSNTASNGTQ